MPSNTPQDTKPTPQLVKRVYLSLTLINTLAASFIWGINTLFLLDAGLTNTQAFLANAFFTLGQMVFEIPTGVVADTKGRRTSYLLGTLTLSLSTLLYVSAWWMHAPFVLWAVSSILLGLGFTFFSGATEAWLVDSLKASGYKKDVDDVFASGQSVSGVAMLIGALGGGLIAQFSSLVVPYFIRSFLLLCNFLVAYVWMKDWGFVPTKSKSMKDSLKTLFVSSVTYSWHRPAIRWLMLAAPLSSGVGFYAFYAMQPHLLNLYGDQTAYFIAGLAASIMAGAQIIGGLCVPALRRLISDRKSLLVVSAGLNALVLVLISFNTHFFVALILMSLWALVFAATMPVRQAYLNDLIPSNQRATVISLDSLMGSTGGVVIQPTLGKVADVWSYPASFFGAAVFQGLSVPLIWLTRRRNSRTV